MKKVSEIQAAIFEQTGLKTSAKKMTGSMKRHIKIWPIFQGGIYPNFPYEWLSEFKKQFKGIPETDTFPYCTVTDLNLPAALFEFDPIKYPKESKPKPIDPDKAGKGWGSKNSQMRLDKAAARYSAAIRRGENRARYY